MNKFICALLVTVASMMNADMLLNAIKRHDLDRVTVLLKQNKYDPTSYVLYINSAREIVEKCRNDVLIQSLNHGMDPLFGAAGTAAFIASAHTVYNMFDKYLDFELKGTSIYDLKTDLLSFVGWSFLSRVFFGLATIVRDGEVETAYNEAVKIQQLILELPYG